MKHCPSCHEPYGDELVFCELDGTHLVEGPQTAAGVGLSTPGPPAPAERVIDLKTLSMGLALGILVCIATLAFFGLTRRGGGGQEKLPEPVKAADQTATAPPRRSSYEPTPAEMPTPEAAPTPSAATPAPTVAPTAPPPDDGLDTLADSPAAAGSAGGRGERRLAIHLNDGVTLQAEDAWRAPGGVWYRQGGVTALLQRSRIRSVERLPVPEPSPSPSAQ